MFVEDNFDQEQSNPLNDERKSSLVEMARPEESQSASEQLAEAQ